MGLESLLKGRLPSLPGSLFQGSATLAVRDSSSCGAGTPRVWFKAITPRLSLGPTEKSGHFLAPASEIFTRIDELKGGLITHFAGKPSSPQPSICREYKGRFNPAPVPLSPARPAPSRRPPGPGHPHRTARPGAAPFPLRHPRGIPGRAAEPPEHRRGRTPGPGSPAGGSSMAKAAMAARPAGKRRRRLGRARSNGPELPAPSLPTRPRHGERAAGGAPQGLRVAGPGPSRPGANRPPSSCRSRGPRSEGRAWAPARAEDSERRCRPRDRAGGQCPGCSTARELFPRGHGGH